MYICLQLQDREPLVKSCKAFPLNHVLDFQDVAEMQAGLRKTSKQAAINHVYINIFFGFP